MAEVKFINDYGDGEKTNDLVLWLNGEPQTEHVICKVCVATYVAYVYDERIGYYDSIHEAEDAILKKLKLC